MKLFVALVLSGMVLSACHQLPITYESTSSKSGIGGARKLVRVSEVRWEQLNPARGDQSPKAATLWGNRNGKQATGYLLRPVDGFRSPPHIHNVSYRALVIRGLIHNDEPEATETWMSAGSFWTQPKGQVHVTHAKGSDTLAYIEIDEGPYLVFPPERAFENEDKAIHVDASKIVWMDQAGESSSHSGPKQAFLWGDQQSDRVSGSLVKLPVGFNGVIRSYGPVFRAVVIKGMPLYQNHGDTDLSLLEPGSYFSSLGKSEHRVRSIEGESTIYVRMEGSFDVIQFPKAK